MDGKPEVVLTAITRERLIKLKRNKKVNKEQVISENESNVIDAMESI